MEQKQNTVTDNWREDITPTRKTLKINDGELSIFTFLDEGKKKFSEDYGESIVFSVKVEGEDEEKHFYVKANNFSLLGQIKELGTLTGLKVEVSRTGSKKSDTRYNVKKR